MTLLTFMTLMCTSLLLLSRQTINLEPVVEFPFLQSWKMCGVVLLTASYLFKHVHAVTSQIPLCTEFLINTPPNDACLLSWYSHDQWSTTHLKRKTFRHSLYSCDWLLYVFMQIYKHILWAQPSLVVRLLMEDLRNTKSFGQPQMNWRHKNNYGHGSNNIPTYFWLTYLATPQAFCWVCICMYVVLHSVCMYVCKRASNNSFT